MSNSVARADIESSVQFAIGRNVLVPVTELIVTTPGGAIVAVAVGTGVLIGILTLNVRLDQPLTPLLLRPCTDKTY